MVIINEIKTAKQIPKDEFMTGGHFACAGCMPALSIKLTLKALGKNTIIINPSGCMTLTTTYPFTPYKVPWILNAIENAASTASGIIHGLKAIKKDKKVNVVCHAGDGATYDLGIGALSGIVQRKENIIYICYNNSSFANTGFQHSSATPYGARTTTTPPGVKNPVGNLLPRKNMAKVMAAHGAPYVATACTSYPFDFMNKLRKAAKIKGTKFIDILCPCVLGWKLHPSKGVEVGRLMVQTGIWPLYEIEDGKFKLNLIPNLKPVQKAFELQGRFKHLRKKDIKKIQGIVNKEWKLLKQGKYWETFEY
jgi:pyruvate ferredoxin oxidoreductase beta subunit